MKPLLSIVVTSRNDNHGGDAMKRMHIFMNGLISQTNKFELPCELIFVDWNPPSEKPLLHEVLNNPKAGDFLSVKYIMVPTEIHKKMSFNDIIPLYQMIAKNVGIRRASADFILCTNIDLLFNDQIFEHIKSNQLSEGYFYRANRCDVPADLNESWPVAEQLSYCKEHVLQVLGHDSTKPYDPLKEGDSILYKSKSIVPSAIYNYYKNNVIKTYSYHKIKSLDTEACGDFTLMHKNDWMRIKGYQEFQIYSLHIDTIALISAYAIGIQQVVWPTSACAYHMAHTGGWEHTNALDKLLFYTKRPVLDWYAVSELGHEMITKKEIISINKGDWGFADENFQTYLYP